MTPVRPMTPDRPTRPARPAFDDRPGRLTTSNPRFQEPALAPPRPQSTPRPQPAPRLDASESLEPLEPPPHRTGTGLWGWLLAVVALTWAATAWLTPTNPASLASLFALLAATSPLASIVALAGGTLNVLRHKFWALTLLIPAGILPWFMAGGYLSASAEPVANPVTVRAMVLNTDSSAADPAEIARVVRENVVDVLVLTEISPAFTHDLANQNLSGLMPRWVADSSGTSVGIGLWSRYPALSVEQLSQTHHPSAKVVLDCNGTKLTVFAAQTVSPDPTQVRHWQSDLTVLGRAAKAEPGPTLILAKLYATSWNPQFRELASGSLADAASQIGRGVRASWPNWMPLLPLDHILLGHAQANSMRSESVGGAHRALVAQVRFAGG
jgi:hypothetical protein